MAFAREDGVLLKGGLIAPPVAARQDAGMRWRRSFKTKMPDAEELLFVVDIEGVEHSTRRQPFLETLVAVLEASRRSVSLTSSSIVADAPLACAVVVSACLAGPQVVWRGRMRMLSSAAHGCASSPWRADAMTSHGTAR